MALKQVVARKTLETLLEEMHGENRLKRILGPVALTSLGIGSIIGAGIFVTTGRAAALDAGPAIVLSYMVAAMGCALAALCYAEFAAMAPVAGSAYTYAYATLGEIFAWIIGWDLILEYAMACATVASAWTGYLNEFLRAGFGVEFPARFSSDPFTMVDVGGVEIRPYFNLPSVVIVLLATFILVRGIRESATANTVLVLVKLAVVLFVIFVGIGYVDAANWTGIPIEERVVSTEPGGKWGLLGLFGVDRLLGPLDESVRSPFAPYGFSGIMLGASIVFFAYIGFDSISTHSEEAKNPQRDVPIGILASLVLCTILYVAVAAVITGMERYPSIDLKAPIAAAFGNRMHEGNGGVLRGATLLISAGALAGMTSVLLVTFLSQVRIFLAMSRDGLMPEVFGVVHKNLCTPHVSTMITGAVIACVAAFTPIVKLEEMVNIGTLMAFVIVCASVLLLRIQRPDAARPFRCPAVWLVAPMGIVVNMVMMLFLPIDTWIRLVAWLAIGLAIYFAYGIRHSRLGRRILVA